MHLPEAILRETLTVFGIIPNHKKLKPPMTLLAGGGPTPLLPPQHPALQRLWGLRSSELLWQHCWL